MIVKSVTPQFDKNQLLNAMKSLFEQYDICKRTPGNPDRDEYASAVESAVERLSDKEKELITQRYMIDYYRKDYQVYSFILDPPISKETYMKIRHRAFSKLFIMLSEKGIVREGDV
ncbi:hypothetical protein [Paenibacillus campinasensis]|nr:hypothetical protein [Paenibacillus campinasensis]